MREKVWTDEQKTAQSERMKARWAAGKMGHKKVRMGLGETLNTITLLNAQMESKRQETQEEPSLQELSRAALRRQTIAINVDWATIPIAEAQALFGQLRDTMNHAGKILNNRLMETPRYPCGGSSGAGCGKLITDLEAKGSDSGFTNTDGLIEKILLCSELCWNNYQRKRLDDKHKSRMRA